MRAHALPFPVAALIFLAACGAPGPSPTMPEARPLRASEISQDRPTEIPLPTPTLPDQMEFTHAGTIPAPEFPAGNEWLNVSRPLHLAQDLRGKIVLLDFWTQGCINCLHIIPDLKRLEAEFPTSLVVVGVHSAKFTSEGEMESIRQAVLRYGIEHPVVNDTGYRMWGQYGVGAWPTVFLIDPLGNLVGYHAGESVYGILRPFIANMAEEYGAAGLIDTRPLDLLLESRSAVPTILSFPGKVLADEAGGRLFIADSNHNRIVVSDLDGEIRYTIGSGQPGFENGSFADTTFRRPQGMALSPDGTLLYIADLENHAIRTANLDTGLVSTIAGTGYQGAAYPNGSEGRKTALSSPWDILLADHLLFIATAGLHQVWVLDLEKDRIEIFAGSGLEGIDDGRPLQASLAQPSGLAAGEGLLYIADPESSAIRQVPLDGSASLQTLVGAGLFAWGDVDGDFQDARLQHPLGIAYADGVLYVADTYNHKIKRIDPLSRTSETWIGTGALGWQDGHGIEARLAEPSGLSIAGGKVYIADTNNHLVRIADLLTGDISTLVLSNLQAAVPPDSTLAAPIFEALGVRTVAPGEGILEFNFSVSSGFAFNAAAPFSLRWTADGGIVHAETGAPAGVIHQTGPAFPITFPVLLEPGDANLEISATVFYCSEGAQSVCLVQEVAIHVPISISSGSVGSDILIGYEVPVE